MELKEKKNHFDEIITIGNNNYEPFILSNLIDIKISLSLFKMMLVCNWYFQLNNEYTYIFHKKKNVNGLKPFFKSTSILHFHFFNFAFLDKQLSIFFKY